MQNKHITHIYGTSKNNQTHITVMEFLNGGSLQDRLISPSETLKATLRKMLETDPEKRYQTAKSVINIFKNLSSHDLSDTDNDKTSVTLKPSILKKHPLVAAALLALFLLNTVVLTLWYGFG